MVVVIGVSCVFSSLKAASRLVARICSRAYFPEASKHCTFFSGLVPDISLYGRPEENQEHLRELPG